MSPKEVLVQRGLKPRAEETLSRRYITFELEDWLFTLDAADERLRGFSGTATYSTTFEKPAAESTVCPAP
jgi:hypothetical protein